MNLVFFLYYITFSIVTIHKSYSHFIDKHLKLNYHDENVFEQYSQILSQSSLFLSEVCFLHKLKDMSFSY